MNNHIKLLQSGPFKKISHVQINKSSKNENKLKMVRLFLLSQQETKT